MAQKQINDMRHDMRYDGSKMYDMVERVKYTANHKFCYDQMLEDGQTLHEHAILLNHHLMAYNPSWVESSSPNCNKRGSWSMEINVCRIGNAIQTCTSESTIEDIAEAIHNGWCDCFNFWYKHKPWTRKNIDGTYDYGIPFKQLKFKRVRAKTAYRHLNDYQKNILKQMAFYVKYACLSKVTFKIFNYNKIIIPAR